jgi:hypothetical protein
MARISRQLPGEGLFLARLCIDVFSQKGRMKAVAQTEENERPEQQPPKKGIPFALKSQ